jgi:hypothetical protein
MLTWSVLKFPIILKVFDVRLFSDFRASRGSDDPALEPIRS